MKQKLLKILYKIFAIFARIYLKRTKPKIIGVTGSVGKTSARMIIFQVLQKYLPEQQLYTSPKNFNSEIGLILSIFCIENYTPSIVHLLKLFVLLLWKSIFQKKSYDILVLEYGVDHPGDMDFLLQIAKPYYSVFTKLDYIHAANFSSKMAVGKEKVKLLLYTREKCFLNFQDDFQKTVFPILKQDKSWYNKDPLALKYEEVEGKIRAFFRTNQTVISSSLLGAENAMYIKLAFEILQEFGTIEMEQEAYLNLQHQYGRFSVFQGLENSILIDSSYNAGPQSMKQMVDNAVQLQKDIFTDYKLLFVLGDMREIGEQTEKVHKELFAYTQTLGKIISVGKESKAYFGEHLGNFTYAQDAGKFLREYLEKSKEKYVILFKGSQNTIFLEEAIAEVLKDPAEKQSLVRQESYWKKREF